MRPGLELGRRAAMGGVAMRALWPGWGLDRGRAAVEVCAGLAAGQIRVVNRSGVAQALRTRIDVQGLQGAVWRSLPTEMLLTMECRRRLVPALEECVTVLPGHVVEPPPWLGFSCGGQCSAPCRANVYLGPGPFRFEVRACDGRRFLSGAFVMPGRPSRG